MKINLMKLLSIFFLLSIVLSCKTTTYRLTSDEVLPFLDESNLEVAVVDLLFNHYYWKLKANDDRYIVGEISRKERDEKRDLILKELESMIPPD